MAVSVRMDPLLEKELEAAARRKGVTKSQFIVDAVERALGRKNPHELLLQVQEELASYDATPQPDAAPAQRGQSTGEAWTQDLEAKHQRDLQDWEAFQQAKRTAAGSK